MLQRAQSWSQRLGLQPSSHTYEQVTCFPGNFLSLSQLQFSLNLELLFTGLTEILCAKVLSECPAHSTRKAARSLWGVGCPIL